MTFTTSLTDQELLELWEEAKENGVKLKDLAGDIGISWKSLDSKLYRAKKKLSEAEEEKFEKPEEKVTVSDTGNRRTIVSKGTRIKTPAQLKERCEIDMDEWVETYANVETWEGYRRDEQKDLIFDEGKISGTVYDQGKLTIETLYKVELKLVKREPVALRPMVVPISFELSHVVKPTIAQRLDGYERALILTDPHFGFLRDMMTGTLISFHDRDAISIALQVAALMQPDRIIIAGDIFDFAEMSDKFAKQPGMYFTTQPAIAEAGWFIAQLKAICPEATIDIIEGNHDDRLTRLLAKHMIAACELRQVEDYSGFPVMSVPHLLRLNELGINYSKSYPKGEVWLNNTILVSHGNKARAKSGATASAILEEAQVDEITGHIHRRERLSKTLHSGAGSRIVTVFSPGCLCKTDNTLPASGARVNWQQGVGIVEYDLKDRFPPHYSTVEIENGATLYKSLLLTAEDYVDQLNDDTEDRYKF